MAHNFWGSLQISSAAALFFVHSLEFRCSFIAFQETCGEEGQAAWLHFNRGPFPLTIVLSLIACFPSIGCILLLRPQVGNRHEALLIWWYLLITVNDQGKVVKTDEEWKKILSPLQYNVCRNRGTERPWRYLSISHLNNNSRQLFLMKSIKLLRKGRGRDLPLCVLWFRVVQVKLKGLPFLHVRQLSQIDHKIRVGVRLAFVLSTNRQHRYHREGGYEPRHGADWSLLCAVRCRKRSCC